MFQRLLSVLRVCRNNIVFQGCCSVVVRVFKGVLRVVKGLNSIVRVFNSVSEVIKVLKSVWQ